MLVALCQSMCKNIRVFLLLLSCHLLSAAYAQMYRQSFHAGIDVPLSYMDANTKSGIGFRGGYRYAAAKKFGIGSEVFIQRLAGGAILSKNFKDPDNTGLFFSSNVIGTSFVLDYTLSIGRRDFFEIGP